MAREIGTRTALTIAGFDPSGGAGLQMDLKCFAALGVHGCSVVTAITVQNTAQVRSVFALPPTLVNEQLDAIYDDFKVDVVKTGMLHDASIVGVVAARVAEEGTPLVVDPVLNASVGASLSSADLVAALKERLLPKALLVTPNIPEAEELTGLRIRGEEGLRRACLELFQLGCESVLIKGGHLPGGPANDLFYDGTFRVYEGERLDRSVHGTGCMLSAFTAAELARGASVQDAVGLAKRLVTDAIRFAGEPGKGRSIGNPLTGFQNSGQKSPQR
jgi:hydroxymethylpyrimidine/phosphomethylpyrimidine kinase